MTYKIKARDYVHVSPSKARVFEVLRLNDDDHLRVASVTGHDTTMWVPAHTVTLFAEYLADALCGCPVYARVGVQHVGSCRDNKDEHLLGVEPESRTQEANEALADERHFGDRVGHGEVVARSWSAGWSLNNDDRDHLRAYAEWLMRVADRAS
jgi:hypothetical protein